MSTTLVKEYKPIGHYPTWAMAWDAATAMNLADDVKGYWEPVQVGGGWKIQRQVDNEEV